MTKNERKALAELEFELTKPHTQEEIAAFLGVSQKTVSVIEARALRKLRALINPDWEDGISEHRGNDGHGIKFR